MSIPLAGKDLLFFLKNNKEMTRQEQLLKAGYKTLLEFANAIAKANKLYPGFWDES